MNQAGSTVLNSDLAALTAKAACLKERLQQTPALPSLARRIREETLAKGACAAAALEGEIIPLDAMRRFVRAAPAFGPDGGPWRRPGLLRAFLRINAGVSLALTSDSLAVLHAAVMSPSPEEGGGRSRFHDEGVPGAPQGFSHARRSVDDLMRWLAGLDQTSWNVAGNDILRPALAHYHLLRIAPFGVSDGALARLFEAALMRAPGTYAAQALMQEYYLGHIEEYRALAPGRDEQSEARAAAFVAFVVQGGIACLTQICGEVEAHLRALVLERHISDLREKRALTMRQYDLLRMLSVGDAPAVSIHNLMRLPPFTALYGRASEQTARRDIRKLERMGLLRRDKDGLRLCCDALELEDGGEARFTS